MSIRETATDRLGPLVPGGKFGYTGRARRYARSLRRSGRALATPGLYPHNWLVKTYWWEREPNFGDLLTPLLLPDFGVVPLFAPAASADLIGVGSLIQQLPQDYTGTLWGTGLIRDEPTPLPQARALAVRGELTLDHIGSPAVHALGDPGLLLARRIRRTETRFDVGVVPHYIHRDEPHFTRLLGGHHDKVAIIDVRAHPLAVARRIASCRAVVTSSLHGLIVADSLGIPACWVRSAAELFGGDFKFRDHETVAKPAKPRDRVLAEVESLAEAVAHCVPADVTSVARAQERLAEAARMIPARVPNRASNPVGMLPHALALA